MVPITDQDFMYEALRCLRRGDVYQAGQYLNMCNVAEADEVLEVLRKGTDEACCIAAGMIEHFTEDGDL